MDIPEQLKASFNIADVLPHLDRLAGKIKVPLGLSDTMNLLSPDKACKCKRFGLLGPASRARLRAVKGGESVSTASRQWKCLNLQ
jgi:hypothetical protein